MNNVDTIKFELIDMITEAYNKIVSLSDDSQVKVFETMMNDNRFNKSFVKLAAIKKMKDLNRAMYLGRSMNFNENEFKYFIDNFYSGVGSDSDNFRSVMSYYHGDRRGIASFISGVNYYMNTMDADDITYYDAIEDLKVMKKLYKLIKEFVEIYCK